MPDRAVIVGASLAGLRAAGALRAGGHDGSITVIGEEHHRPYDRPPLSKQILAGKVEPDATLLPCDDSLGIEWRLGARAERLEIARRRVVLAGGEMVPYDRLVIATGSRLRMLPGTPPGPGVHYLRTIDEALALRDDLRSSEGLVVIGAGFIGLEVASTAHQLGIPVVVVEALPVPLERAIGPEMGRAVMEWHRHKGLEIRTSVSVEEIVGSDRPSQVRLSDGTTVDADTVVVGIGVAPATEWLDGSGLDLGDGVICDERLRVHAGGTALPDVVAAGDVARWAHPAYGSTIRVEHWTNAAEGGEAAARALLLGDDAPPYAPIPYFWSDQHGAKLQFVGNATAGDEIEVLEGSFEDDRVLVAYGRDGRLVAALGLRRPARVMAMQRMISDEAAFPPQFEPAQR